MEYILQRQPSREVREEIRQEGLGSHERSRSVCDEVICDRSNVVTSNNGYLVMECDSGESPRRSLSCTQTSPSSRTNQNVVVSPGQSEEAGCFADPDEVSNYLSINNSRSSSCCDIPEETSPMISGNRPRSRCEADDDLEGIVLHRRTQQLQKRAARQQRIESSDCCDIEIDTGAEEEEEEEDDDSMLMSTNSAATTATVTSNKSQLIEPEVPIPGLDTSVNIVDNPVGDGNDDSVGQAHSAADVTNNRGINGVPAQTQQQQQHSKITTTSSNLSNCSGLPTVTVVQLKQKQNLVYFLRVIFNHCKSSGIGEPSVYHALVVIFLEFFAWGLLTMPVITVLNQTFPDHTFLMNGLVMGIKGILSFLSAPLIGALSDVWGRKFFLLITVFFTCAPIPLMSINSWWFFAMISISGVFAVTFSVVFAYVADVTTVEDRSRAYGLVSATFAASLVISPALGAYLNDKYSEPLIVALATAIAVLDVFFILVAVPESLPEKVRPSSWGAPISWEQADPFAALRKVGLDHTILMQCVTVLLSYLPEAGQYSCIFVYLKLKMHFSSIDVSIFIAVVGILSILAQVILGDLMKALGAKRTIIIGLLFEMLQLLWYGFGSQTWMMWAAGILASLASITYPAISAFVSIHSNPDQQGVVQGMVTGMRGLCNGLGPAMFGVIFYLFHVDLNDEHNGAGSLNGHTGSSSIGSAGIASLDGSKFVRNETLHGLGGSHIIEDEYSQLMPGPPFVFGALMVVCAIAVAAFIPEASSESIRRPSGEKKKSDYRSHDKFNVLIGD
ncbi:hippocampus abundant transcript 1 protein isoform X3 [Toxorhynchites rutilus septentrionalis]|uniref:hippocampus abundant transcript 1 protein isoform X3 n=1 Tax=Toxorhynchites rutilus septentrionalis TaxID=329112 RepID=UPI00247B072E|nr:hippocampus abundant transcript 1 protein isoform X3 [Toxorhynchites rutilus septentrionalis]XP_055631689.1 hippocampus abundant transcript 1 protein isoform X3 [Toxorhynchites rutilus septentrionalis]